MIFCLLLCSCLHCSFHTTIHCCIIDFLSQISLCRDQNTSADPLISEGSKAFSTILVGVSTYLYPWEFNSFRGGANISVVLCSTWTGCVGVGGGGGGGGEGMGGGGVFFFFYRVPWYILCLIRGKRHHSKPHPRPPPRRSLSS